MEIHIPENYVLLNITIDDATGIENCSVYLNDVLNNTYYTIINHDYNYF
ncbi:MAG: hypothetical protein KatS3mg002_1236 [Candidatus Woesearchaeota archaeon]|nr:MAG: hypothetical protein KatS3mg002_1236 [Candidatus Woesearchaeota archaeon]